MRIDFQVTSPKSRCAISSLEFLSILFAIHIKLGYPPVYPPRCYNYKDASVSSRTGANQFGARFASYRWISFEETERVLCVIDGDLGCISKICRTVRGSVNLKVIFPRQ